MLTNEMKKMNHLVAANLLSLGVEVVMEVAGNEVANKTSASTPDVARALAARINSNLSKHKEG